MATQSQPAAADHRHPGNMAHHVQQLQQAGFDDSQVRALASFVSDMARETMRPFVERVEQRFDAVDQRFDEVNLRLGDMQQQMNQRLGDMQQQMDQRLGDMQQQTDQRVSRVETCLEHLEQNTRRLGEGLARMDARVEDLQRREWVILTMVGLGFISIVVAILLAAGAIG